MNKKFLGVLSAAVVLLSQGSPIFAQEMVEVESGSVPGTNVEQATEIALDSINFPDANFRAAVKIAYSKVVGMTSRDFSGNVATIGFSNADTAIPNTFKAKVDDLAKIVTLVSTVADPAKPAIPSPITQTDPGASGAADYDYTNSKVASFKDLTGIKYLTGLQYLSLLHSPKLKIADLRQNSELVEIALVPVYDSTTIIGGVPPISVQFSFSVPTAPGTLQIDHSELYSIVLPKNKDNLEKLTVAGADQLTTLDLSTYTFLNEANLQLNELAVLNVSGCSSLMILNVSGNELTGLDLSMVPSLEVLRAPDNNLYEVAFPAGKRLYAVNLSDNKLATIDISSLKGLTTLDLSDNRLENLNVSYNSNLNKLNVANNHLATLDLSNTTFGSTAPEASDSLVVSPQFLYANIKDRGIDLVSYDKNFQVSTGTPAVGWISNNTSPMVGTIKSGVFELGSNATLPNSYSYNIGVSGNGTTMRVIVVLANLMNRLYNPNSGEHFYTADLNEKDTLVKLGWQYEGIGWVAPQENATNAPTIAGEAVFRLYNSNAGDHHYTKDSREKDVLVRAGWNYEGVGWYSATEHNDNLDTVKIAGTATTPITENTIKSYSIKVYREYNPNAKEAGAHNYTTSENENDTLVSFGWLDEGIGWWALK